MKKIVFLLLSVFIMFGVLNAQAIQPTGELTKSVSFNLPTSLSVNTVMVQQDSKDGALFIGFGKSITEQQIVEVKTKTEQSLPPLIKSESIDIFKIKLPAELLNKLTISQCRYYGWLDFDFKQCLTENDIEAVKRYVAYYYWELQPMQSKYNPFSPDIDMRKNRCYMRFYKVLEQ